MIGDWIGQWPALLAAGAAIFGPGLAVGFALRLRGLALWALAPVGSTALLGGMAIAFGAVGIVWTLPSVLIGTVVAVGVAFAAGAALGPRNRPPATATSGRLILGIGLGIGILLAAARFGIYVGSPSAISQTNDAVFHLNAIRYALDTGSASSFDLLGVLGGSGFYPGAWHALASVVVLASGASIPAAANMVSLLVTVAVWPVGIAWFTRTATRSTSTASYAAALSPALLAFPMLMVQWGVLYPYALAIALLPAAAGVVVGAPAWLGGKGPVAGRRRSVMHLAVVTLAGVGALALAQPAVLLAWMVLAAVWFTWWAGLALRRARPRAPYVFALGVVWIVFAAGWLILTRGTSGSQWAPFDGKLDALLDVLLNGPVTLPYAPAVSALMVVGLVVAVRRPSLRWLATSWVVFAGLYFLAASVGQPVLRRLLVGAWYADPYRLAALLPVTVIPLAAAGLAAIVGWAATAIGSGSREERTLSPMPAPLAALAAIGVIGIVAVAVVPIVQMPRITEGTPDSRSRYIADSRSFLSPDEVALLARLDEEVPKGARIIGNPSTGSGFGYMLSGEDVYPRTWSPPSSSEWAVLAERLRDADIDPTVCDALAAYGADYILDFGGGEQGTGRQEMPGMTDFTGQPGFQLVDSEGDASLWRITACAR